MKKQAWLLCGPTGSGKSTFRKEMKEACADFLVSSSDDYILALCAGLGLTYQDAYMKFSAEAEDMAQTMIRRAVEEQRDIMIDRTNLSAGRRAAIISQLAETHDIVAVVPDFDPASDLAKTVLTQRLNSRTDREPMPIAALLNHIEAWQKPVASEGYMAVLMQSQLREAIFNLSAEAHSPEP